MTRVLILAFFAFLFVSCKNSPLPQQSQDKPSATPPPPQNNYFLTEGEQAEVIETMGEVGIEMDGEALESVMDENIDVDGEG